MANEAMRQNWSIGGLGWVANERIFDAVLAPFSDAVAGRADVGPGDRVLDVGCGTGTLLEWAASCGASPTGVDISAAMVDAARRRVPDAAVVLADAQTADLLDASPGPPFDRVVSRFGVMFFDDPSAAFANVRRAAAPGARLTFVCWRTEETAMFTLGTSVLTARLDPPPPPPDPNAPGPTALGDPGRIRDVLGAGGWRDVAVEPVDGVCDYGFDGTDGVEERLAVIFASANGRAARAELEPRLGPEGWAELVDEVRAELRRHLVDGAVRITGRTWLVTATNP